VLITIFFVKTLAISCIQLIIVFCLVATLCEDEGTLDVVVRSEDISVPFTFPQQGFETNPIEVSKVQPKSWHAAMVEFHNLSMQLAID
jgi:hypothetical protein